MWVLSVVDWRRSRSAPGAAGTARHLGTSGFIASGALAHRRPWHATVVRLVAPPSDAFVARLRRGVPEPGTRVTFRTVDVVHTNKVMAPGRTTTLASFELD